MGFGRSEVAPIVTPITRSCDCRSSVRVLGNTQHSVDGLTRARADPTRVIIMSNTILTFCRWFVTTPSARSRQANPNWRNDLTHYQGCHHSRRDYRFLDHRGDRGQKIGSTHDNHCRDHRGPYCIVWRPGLPSGEANDDGPQHFCLRRSGDLTSGNDASKLCVLLSNNEILLQICLLISNLKRKQRHSPSKRKRHASRNSKASSRRSVNRSPSTVSRLISFSVDVAPLQQALARRLRRSIAIRSPARRGAAAAKRPNGSRARGIVTSF